MNLQQLKCWFVRIKDALRKCIVLMRFYCQSIVLSFLGLYVENPPFNSKVQHPPRATPRAFELLKIGFFKFPPSGQERRSNAPPISTELPLLKDKFGLQSITLHAFQREICRNDTFNLLLKTLYKELFTNKGEILSCKSVRTRENRKNSVAYYVRTRDKSGSSSLPFQRNV